MNSLEDDKALDIEVIKLNSNEVSALADYIIVASGTSSTQTKSIAQKLKDRMNVRGLKDIRIEGLSQGDWVVVDLGDIVVHVFKPEVREFYNIEKMWTMGETNSTNNGLQLA